MAQSSQSGRVVTLVAVSQGQVYVANAGGTAWGAAFNATGTSLSTTAIVRSASNNQKLWFADGAHWLYYDPSLNQVLAWTASSGSLPGASLSPVDYPRLIATWRGRTVVSGIQHDPQNWFMSAVGDPANWNYSPFPYTPTAAVAGNNSPLGLVGDVITSLVPYSDDILVFGGDHTVWMTRGDPLAGGQIDLVSDTIGFAWGAPWCKGPDGTLYFFSNKMGIYAVMPGQGAPTRMSQPIESLLASIDTGANIIRMAWDDLLQGLHIFVSATASASAATHFFWEQRTGAWWTDVFANSSHNPCCTVTIDGNLPSDRVSLLGSWDGYVRCMASTQTTDDGTAISSAVIIGPLLTKDLDEVLLKYLQCVLGESSGDVSYAVYVASTAEKALASTPVATGTWSAGRNLNTLIRFAGHAVYVKITATNYWAMEAIRASIAGLGGVRRRGY